MQKFLVKPLMNVIEKRENMINSQFKEAEAAETEAKSLKAKYEDSLKNAHDESISILNKAKINARAEYDRIVLVVNIYQAVQRQQHFGLIENAFIRIVDDATGKELIHFDLGEDFSIETAVVVGELYKHNGEWKFNAIGSGFQGGLAALCGHYGIEVA